MKYALLIMGVFFFSDLRAINDTITIAQAYNFNIGDTFDYKTADFINNLYESYSYNVSFERDVVINKWFDSTDNSLKIVLSVHYPVNPPYDQVLTKVFPNPQQYAFSVDSCQQCQTSLYIDSSSPYGGKILNGNYIGGFEGYAQNQYVPGLGNVFTLEGNDATGADAVFKDSTYLIYYSKGSEVWGTPYYVADGENDVHFTPIPESCAVWNDFIYTSYDSSSAVYEQIRTGNIVPFNGHSYVEMIYRSDSVYVGGSNVTPDSLIGYFRNDTINQQTLFYQTLSNTSFFSYNFKQLVDGMPCSHIDKIWVNGQWRTRWTYGEYGSYFGFNQFDPSTQLSAPQYVEGIGGLNGLIPVYHRCGYYSFGYSCALGTLTCFSVCGQTIYPPDSIASCPVVTDTQTTTNYNTLNLFPTINNGQFQIDIAGGSSYNILINDILGRQVLDEKISASENFFVLKNIQTGVYIWRAINNEKVVQTGKFMVVSFE